MNEELHGLSTRAKNVLRVLGIKSKKDLIKLGPPTAVPKILRLEAGCGPRTISEIQRWIGLPKMTEINTGGPAFPIDYESAVETQDGIVSSYGTGMTLRDYFAAKAMQTVVQMSHDELQEFTCEYAEEVNTSRLVAIAAYQTADAMLKARAGESAL